MPTVIHIAIKSTPKSSFTEEKKIEIPITENKPIKIKDKTIPIAGIYKNIVDKSNAKQIGNSA